MADFDGPTPDRFLRTTPNHARILATVAQRDEAVRLLGVLSAIAHYVTANDKNAARAFLAGLEK